MTRRDTNLIGKLHGGPYISWALGFGNLTLRRPSCDWAFIGRTMGMAEPRGGYGIPSGEVNKWAAVALCVRHG